MKDDLTEQLIEQLRIPKGKNKLSVTSDKIQGLTLVIQYYKNKLNHVWHYRFKIPSSTRRTSIKVGIWPTMDQDKAIQSAQVYEELVEKGINPVLHMNRAKNEQKRNIIDNAIMIPVEFRVNAIAEKWLSHCEKTIRIGSVQKYRSSYNAHILEKYANADIRHFDIIDYEEFLAEREGVSVAASVHRAMRAIFSFAYEKEIIKHHPLLKKQSILKKIKVSPRTRYFSPEEIHKFLNELENQDEISEDVKVALLLQLYLGIRIGEILAIRWEDFNPKSLKITHPHIFMKNGKPSVTLTSDQVRIILLKWKRKCKKNGINKIRVFDDALSVDKIGKEVNKLIDWLEFNTHDLRRSCNTYLQHIDCPAEIRSAILNHAEPTGVKAAYDLAELEYKQLKWLRKWSDKLDEIKVDPKKIKIGIEYEDDDQILQEFRDVI